MSRLKLRNSIALEAARLMLRGKETDYATARKRAARWLSRRKLDAADMPSAAEIQTQLYALSGLFVDEHRAAAVSGMRAAALELMEVLAEYDPHVTGSTVDGAVSAGATITLEVLAGSAAGVAETLRSAGFRSRTATGVDNGAAGRTTITLNHGFPCEIVVGSDTSSASAEAASGDGRCGIAELRRLVEQSAAAFPEPAGDEESAPGEHEYHPDAFASFELLLERLEQVTLDPQAHPEGDALYHSLQTFELGVEERPYDEEFLLACLLHDAGLAVDRRDPVGALLNLLRGIVTERTCYLIENLPAGTEFLKTGRAPRSLRRGEDFDDLVLLARCDRDARVCGAKVRDVPEALAYLAGIDGAWDEAGV